MRSQLSHYLFFVFFFVKGKECLKNVEIKTNRWEVNFRDNVILYCNFDLEQENLFSVKWYRGSHEFYRYEPSSQPSKKTFSDYNIKVDLTMSNQTQVKLQQVGYELDGNVSCEVTVDGTYKTGLAHGTLSVISPPIKGPVITKNKDKYKINDTLLANCTSSLSYPSSSLTFLLNDEPVGNPSIQEIHCNQSISGFPTILCINNDNRTTWTWLPLNITLTPEYLAKNHITLVCTSIVKNTSNRNSTTEIITLIDSEPKPERVMKNKNDKENLFVLVTSYNFSIKNQPGYCHMTNIIIILGIYYRQNTNN